MNETVYGAEYLHYQTNRSRLRKTVRQIYLWQVRRHVSGKVLDFGCGAGEHLASFPAGSLGLEINAATVQFCKSKGLNVELYRPEEDNYRLLEIPEKTFGTLVISHVLEHLEQPDLILKQLLESCRRLGIRRLFVTVPCEAGFAHDKTHVTLITKDYVFEKGLDRVPGFQMTKIGYFPFNVRFIGKYFTYNELYWVCDGTD